MTLGIKFTGGVGGHWHANYLSFTRNRSPLLSSDTLTSLRMRCEVCSRAYNYLVEIHWVGSRRQLVEILKGNIPTHRYFVLECHGDDGKILLLDEPALGPDEVSKIVNLPGKVVLNCGCDLGTEAMARAFLNGGCEAYIGAIKEMHSLMFAIHLFYYLCPAPGRFGQIAPFFGQRGLRRKIRTRFDKKGVTPPGNR